ncbi:MAG TPA: hypothetical protein VFE62_05770 [Gemmataceae bacterium]|nr:hypothetical protein [Gemmataceae bacterium]
MSMIVCAFSVMSVALIYSHYRAHLQKVESRDKLLRQRVAYMLWVAANGEPECR